MFITIIKKTVLHIFKYYHYGAVENSHKMIMGSKHTKLKKVYWDKISDGYKPY